MEEKERPPLTINYDGHIMHVRDDLLPSLLISGEEERMKYLERERLSAQAAGALIFGCEPLMMRLVMIRTWPVSVQIDCKECDWNTADHINGRQKAHDHHRQTGHAMRGEVTLHYEWNHRNVRR